jgi:hypothetical protein
MKKYLLTSMTLLLNGALFAQTPSAPDKNPPVVASPQASLQSNVQYVPRAVAIRQFVAVPVQQYQVVAVPQVQYVAVQQVAVQHCAVQNVAVQQYAVQQQQFVQAPLRRQKIVTKTVTKVRGGGLLGRIF